MSQFYCRENDLILFHTSSSLLPILPDQSTALLYLHLLRHPYVKPKTKKFITFFEVFGQLHSCP